MNWFTNLTRPGMKKRQEREKEAAAKDAREDKSGALWITCPETGEFVYLPDLEAALYVTPSGHHMKIAPGLRFKALFDGQSFEKIALPEAPRDPLKFKDDKKYVDRLRASRAKVGRDDCMEAAAGAIGGAPAVVLIQDFAFMGGSLGMAAGEAFITAARQAVSRGAALICVTSSGGARMQEGVLSLMQMPRTTLAIQELKAAGLPYIVILTDPTTGGVSASYAMLGDVHIAEPGATIGFAGKRVIEQTIRQKLPEGFQRAEYLLEKGMVDMVVDRRKHQETLATLLGVLMASRLSGEARQPEASEPSAQGVSNLAAARRARMNARARAAE